MTFCKKSKVKVIFLDGLSIYIAVLKIIAKIKIVKLECEQLSGQCLCIFLENSDTFFRTDRKVLILEKFAYKFKTYICVSSDELGKSHKISENPA